MNNETTRLWLVWLHELCSLSTIQIYLSPAFHNCCSAVAAAQVPAAVRAVGRSGRGAALAVGAVGPQDTEPDEAAVPEQEPPGRGEDEEGEANTEGVPGGQPQAFQQLRPQVKLCLHLRCQAFKRLVSVSSFLLGGVE